MMSFFIPCLLVITGAVIIYAAVNEQKKTRKMSDIPISTVAGLSEGLRTICGTVKALSPQISPVSKKECVYFDVVVSEIKEYKDPNNRSITRTYAEEVYRNTEFDTFHLYDDTGTAMVHPRASHMNLLTIKNWNDPNQQEVKEFFDSHEIRSKNLMIFDRHLHVKETFIEPGDKLYVTGSACPVKSGPHNSGTAMSPSDAPRFVLKTTEEQKLTISDEPPEVTNNDEAQQNLLVKRIGGVLIAAGLIVLLLQICAGFFGNAPLRIYGDSNAGCYVLSTGAILFIAISIYAAKAANRRRDEMMMKSLKRMKRREEMKKKSQ